MDIESGRPLPFFAPCGRVGILGVVLLLALSVGARAAQSEAANTEVAAEPTDEDQPSGLEERVKVSATRLPAASESPDQLPAHVTVIDREQIARSGARTLQDLLAVEAGAVVYDEVGNFIEKTFDLRGFSGGNGTRVFLDGAPLNDTRNNGLSLDLVPLASLDRVEIIRGSAAALAGGGSEAGVIHLRTRQGEGLGGRLSLAAGSFDSSVFEGQVQGKQGRFNFFASGHTEETDGFRQNAGGERTQWSGTGGVKLGGDRRLELSLIHSTSDLGNPGALTDDEIADDPAATPFNDLDFSDQSVGQFSLNFRGTLAGAFSIAANAMHRERDSAFLTTGRTAAMFGGFYADVDSAVSGATIQLTHNHRAAVVENHLTFGLEYLDGESDSTGVFTPPSDPAAIDLSAPSSRNTTDRRTAALFVQETWRPNARLRLSAGFRYDADRVGYTESLPDPSNAETKDFEELSLRAGVNWSASRRHVLYASYGEGFLPPTAEQLFAFPTFGSNRELEPEDSATYELGMTGRYGREAELRLAVLRVDTENEIVFDLDSLRNVNAGETRRDGFEAALRIRPSAKLGLFANLTLMNARFRGGANDGSEIPLVPAERLALGVDYEMPAGLSLRADLLHVGEQVLDGDEANRASRLDAYSVTDVRLVWTAARNRGTRHGAMRGLVIFAEARNVFDEQYATRGIFSSFLGESFLTPAPGRNYLFGVAWNL